MAEFWATKLGMDEVLDAVEDATLELFRAAEEFADGVEEAMEELEVAAKIDEDKDEALVLVNGAEEEELVGTLMLLITADADRFLNRAELKVLVLLADSEVDEFVVSI